HYESLVTPPTVFEEDVRTGQRELLKRTPVLGDFDPGHYTSTRAWAPAPDGALVPLDVVSRRDTPRNGTSPVSLHAYGAYESSRAVWVSIARLSLLDRGVVWALAHPRGGGELGRRWYLDGKVLHKRNTFTDVIACADPLVGKGYGAPERVTLRGGSAGGLLVGAGGPMRAERVARARAHRPVGGG